MFQENYLDIWKEISKHLVKNPLNPKGYIDFLHLTATKHLLRTTLDSQEMWKYWLTQIISLLGMKTINNEYYTLPINKNTSFNYRHYVTTIIHNNIRLQLYDQNSNLETSITSLRNLAEENPDDLMIQHLIAEISLFTHSLEIEHIMRNVDFLNLKSNAPLVNINFLLKSYDSSNKQELSETFLENIFGKERMKNINLDNWSLALAVNLEKTLLLLKMIQNKKEINSFRLFTCLELALAEKQEQLLSNLTMKELDKLCDFSFSTDNESELLKFSDYRYGGSYITYLDRLSQNDFNYFFRFYSTVKNIKQEENEISDDFLLPSCVRLFHHKYTERILSNIKNLSSSQIRELGSNIQLPQFVLSNMNNLKRFGLTAAKLIALTPAKRHILRDYPHLLNSWDKSIFIAFINFKKQKLLAKLSDLRIFSKEEIVTYVFPSIFKIIEIIFNLPNCDFILNDFTVTKELFNHLEQCDESLLKKLGNLDQQHYEKLLNYLKNNYDENAIATGIKFVKQGSLRSKPQSSEISQEEWIKKLQQDTLSSFLPRNYYAYSSLCFSSNSTQQPMINQFTKKRTAEELFSALEDIKQKRFKLNSELKALDQQEREISLELNEITTDRHSREGGNL